MSSPSSEKQLATASSNLIEQERYVSIELPTIYLDPDGDLRLRVGSETEDDVQDFVVCSRTMGRSSSVWKAMLFGGFKESRPVEGEWVVSLPEEQPKALLTVLNIIHGRFTEVPKILSLEQLYLILVLTHKYDMVQKVQPWATFWSSLATLLAEKGKSDNTQLIFVVWELGQEQIFRALVDDLVMACSIDSEGRLTTPNGRRLGDFDYFGPNDLTGKEMPDRLICDLIPITERICDVRRTTIQCLLNLVDEFIRSLVYGLHCVWHKPLPQNDEHRLACDSVILGSFWKSTIKKRGALFPSSAANIRNSVSTLAVEIFNALGDIICDQRHEECNPAPRVQKLVADTVQRRQSAVTSNYLKYMKVRRKELGLANKSAQMTNKKEGEQA